MSFWKKKIKADDASCVDAMINAKAKNHLAFALGKCIKTNDEGIPIEGELCKLGVKVASFGIPKLGDVYVSKGGAISDDVNYVDQTVNRGYRLILDNMTKPEIDLADMSDVKYLSELKKENAMSLAVGKKMKCVDNVPLESSLNGLGIKVLARRPPLSGDFFFDHVSETIRLCETDHGKNDDNCGYRFILANK